MSEKTTCVVVGGGPAGIFAGLLLARAGVEVVVLEKHGDFLRDFRGDTVHPSTLRLLDELGLFERFDKLPHTKLQRMKVTKPDGQQMVMADLTRLRTPHPYIAMVPQWDLLDMLAEVGGEEPDFDLRMNHEVTGLLWDESGRVSGVRYESPAGIGELHADLTLVCDGRWSLCRQEAGLVPREFPVGTDIWWFRAPRVPGIGEELVPRFKDGKLLGIIPRQGYLQIPQFIRKGDDARLRARGVEAFREDLADVVPELSGVVDEIESMDEVKLLDVRINRLSRWYTDGLLCIGDAAHAMSGLGGVGINLAVQDAVAAARILAAPLSEKRVTREDLAAVQRRRMFPAVVTQVAQILAHRYLVDPVFTGGKLSGPGWLLPIIERFGWLTVIPAYFIGIGVRPEHAPAFARRAAVVRA